MGLPGFGGDSVFYSTRMNIQSCGLSRGILHSEGSIVPAASCSCDDPRCTWSCPQPPPPPRDCSTMRCPPGLVCCDCTITHCTTPKECRRECLL
jgi:hypothetical protein